MRKEKFIMVLWVLLLSITVNSFTTQAAEPVEEEWEEAEEEIVPDTEIIFDADAVVHKTAAKSALADMHGVFVFRDAFITQEKLVKEAERKEKEQIEQLVLTSNQPELGYEEWVDLVLQEKTDKYIKDVYYEEESSTTFVWICCGIISICILCVAIIIEDYLKKRKKEKSQSKKQPAEFGFMLIFICLCMPVMTGCTATKSENEYMEGIIQTLQTRGILQKVMELDDESGLWELVGNLEDNRGRLELYVIKEEDKLIQRVDMGELQDVVATGDDRKWQYYDIDGDGRKDIVMTGTFQTDEKEPESSIWIFLQEEDGCYMLWAEEGAFKSIKIRAGI